MQFLASLAQDMGSVKTVHVLDVHTRAGISELRSQQRRQVNGAEELTELPDVVFCRLMYHYCERLKPSRNSFRCRTPCPVDCKSIHRYRLASQECGNRAKLCLAESALEPPPPGCHDLLIPLILVNLWNFPRRFDRPASA